MSIEIINWIACGLTVIGTVEISRKHPHILLVNSLYVIASLLFITVFTLQFNLAMLIMYGVLGLISLRGVIIHGKANAKQTH